MKLKFSDKSKRPIQRSVSRILRYSRIISTTPPPPPHPHCQNNNTPLSLTTPILCNTLVTNFTDIPCHNPIFFEPKRSLGNVVTYYIKCLTTLLLSQIPTVNVFLWNTGLVNGLVTPLPPPPPLKTFWVLCLHYAFGADGPVCVSVCKVLAARGLLHPLPTLQNNEPVPQDFEIGGKPVLLTLTLIDFRLILNKQSPYIIMSKTGWVVSYLTLLILTKLGNRQAYWSASTKKMLQDALDFLLLKSF